MEFLSIYLGLLKKNYLFIFDQVFIAVWDFL